MKKFSILLISLLVLSAFACSSKDDNTISASEIVKKPIALFVENSEGNSWTYLFSYSGNLITKLTTSNGSSTEFKYDSNDKLLYLQSESGRTSYYYTDGKLSSIQLKTNRDYVRTTNLFYNSLNQVSRSTTQENDDREVTYEYTYDSMGRLQESSNEFGDLEKYRYDNINNIFKNVYPQMGPKHIFSWISPQINNIVSHERSSADNLRYQYVYDSDDYPILVKELGSNGEVNVTTTITYE
jgi:YD repeat-containing protein